jgi:hypothetical protein
MGQKMMNLGDATILRDFSYPPTSRVYFSMALMRALASQASFRRTLSGTIRGRGRWCEVRDRKKNSSWQSWYPQPATTQSELTSIDTQVEEHLAVLARNLLRGIAKETFMSRPVVEDSDWENKERIDLEPLVEEVDGMCHFLRGDDAGNRG